MHTPPEPAPNFTRDVHVHRAAVIGWLRSRFPSVADAENLVQEAMTRVWRALSRGAVESPRALLYATTHNLAVDQVRRERVAPFESTGDMLELAIAEDGPSPADTTARRQELELLTQAIQALPERCRQVLTLRKIYGLSQREIAERLGIAEHTVEAQVANGMRRCSHYLSRLGLP